MADYSELIAALPLEDIARALGTDTATARSAVATAIPALLGGMQANAADPAGAASLTNAVTHHDPSLVQGGVSLADVDVADGEKIVHNVFGANEGAVVSRLGASQGAGSGLFEKLLPILAPIVLSFIMKKITGGGATQGSSGGGLGDLLGGILGGGGEAAPTPTPGRTSTTSRTSTPPPAVDINDLLNDMLGGAGSAKPSAGGGSTQGGVEDLLGSVLGGLLGGGRR